MKELEDVLDGVINHFADALVNLDEASYDDSDVHERVRGIRVGTRHLASLCRELLDDIQKRVYCIEVESTVTQRVKILAKNENDAECMAIEVAEHRVWNTLGCDWDYDISSSGFSLGDESPQNDEADEEFEYYD